MVAKKKAKRKVAKRKTKVTRKKASKRNVKLFKQKCFYFGSAMAAGGLSLFFLNKIV